MPVSRKKTRILIATSNRGKLREFEAILRDIPFEVVSLSEFPDIDEPEETGSTFKENAIIKAIYYARETGVLTLADDSGLEVTALENRPGVYSSRYGGVGANFQFKIEKLLKELASRNSPDRSARFVCAMALVNPKEEVLFETEGICEGIIETKPIGTRGFGYDPIFRPTGFDRTFGEIDDAIKNGISHRAIALKKIISFLSDFSASSLDCAEIPPIESAV